jgi:hypothetical protein
MFAGLHVDDDFGNSEPELQRSATVSKNSVKMATEQNA